MAKKRRSSDEFRLKGWYPKTAEASNYYVFLNSLSTDNPGLYNSAAALLKANGDIASFTGEARLQEAINFLHSAAENERRKEINFLRSKGLDVSLDIDFMLLIKEISSAILGIEEYQRRVREEKNRRERLGKGTGQFSYTQGMGSYISAALNQMNQRGRTKNTLAAIVRTELIKSTKSLSGELNLNEIAAVIGAAQSQIMGALQDEIDKDTTKSKYYQKDGKRLSVTKVTELIRQNTIYQSYFGKDASRTVSEFQMIANNILSKYQKVLSAKAEKILEERTKNIVIKQPDVSWSSLGFKQKTIMNITGMSAEQLYTYNFHPNTGMGGEARIYRDLEGMVTSWLGGSGGKADVLSYSIGEVEITETRQQKIDSSIQNIIENINTKTQSEFSKVNTEISKSYQALENSLEEISKELGELQQAFIIHNNVKDYYSTATSDFRGFSGGTYGGLSILDSLSALSSAGFSMADIDWLRVCLVNTASESIGASNKSALERYFSLFATMLLFDDGATIAQEAAKNLSFSSLNVLHLFPVNGIYVPASYVMKTVANSLSNFTSRSQGASVSINTGSVNFKNELEELTKSNVWGATRWATIREKQISAMSVTIRFLANFKAIIDNI